MIVGVDVGTAVACGLVGSGVGGTIVAVGGTEVGSGRATSGAPASATGRGNDRSLLDGSVR